MINNLSIQDFLSRKNERGINQRMLEYSYVFPTEEVLQYVQLVNAISIDSFLYSIMENKFNFQITAKDVFQFSNIHSATIKICKALKTENNPGVNFYQAGKLLLKNEPEKKKAAYIKYGENQLKTAELLGLIFEIEHTYFLSCLGNVLDLLDEKEQNKLILRCLLRSKLIIKLFSATCNGQVDLRQFLYMLSESTYKRRVSNLLHLFQIMNDFGEYDFSPYFSKIKH